MNIKPYGIALALALTTLARPASATQADDTTITVTAKTPGVTPFISQVTLQATDTSVLKSIKFTIAHKAGSVTRPLSGQYSNGYLTERGYLQASGEIFLPVYGLYAGSTNTVILAYNFVDGSSKQATIAITTATYTNSCSLDTPTKILPRTGDTSLSYDYMFVRGSCPGSPVILDTDGAIRWVSPLATSLQTIASSGFFDNAVYVTDSTNLYREDLDGTVTLVADYSALGVINFHHNIDRGKSGIILDVDTVAFTESINWEVDAAGNILETWNLANIISAAMIAGGDDPSLFVFPAPTDWFHNNAVTYRRSDDSFIVSSRENFVIGLDYQTDAIKWILGDETKYWFQFPSLAQFSLALGPDTLPPIGQHGLSITLDNNLLLMDNGRNSGFQMPPGINRDFSIPRKYRLELAVQTAIELKDYPGTENIYSQFCGSVYEDAKNNYVTDYAFILDGSAVSSELLGFNASGAKVFDYMYPGSICDTAYGTLPLHLESTKFPTVGPQALNLSTRAMVGTGDNVLIGGFIVSGSASKTVILRALGPSLGDAGVFGALADPVLKVYDSTGALVVSNDNWQDDNGAATITGDRLDPRNPAEAATLKTLAPGTYTVVVSGKGSTTGVALVEAYDLSPRSGSILANISARGLVGTGDNVLISGFIVGDVASATVVVRALGPSLPATLNQPLGNPSLTVFDSNGMEIGSNDNWQDDSNSADVQLNGLAPSDPAESALLLNLPAGAYTAVVKDAAGGSGIGLAEVYNLH
ncbi:MAG: aryl-sulfate sulfotransferase [Chthoniobacterales bacterium]|nr:aryl-sulfate sulfotransferase [Chthoniobacterales bacterium]